MEDKLALITQNLQEVLNPEIIEDVLRQDRPLCIYWGTSAIFPLVFYPTFEIQKTDHYISNLQAQQLQAGLIAATLSLSLVPRNSLPTSFC